MQSLVPIAQGRMAFLLTKLRQTEGKEGERFMRSFVSIVPRDAWHFLLTNLRQTEGREGERFMRSLVSIAPRDAWHPSSSDLT